MPRLNIVGINGNIGSGKDTVADRFVALGYRKISLADPMKRFVHEVFGFTEDQLWGPSDNRNAVDERYYTGSLEWRKATLLLHKHGAEWLDNLLPHAADDELLRAEWDLQAWFDRVERAHPELSPRICLQLLGTEYGRDTLYPNVWVDHMARTADMLLAAKPSEMLPNYHLDYSRLDGVHTTVMRGDWKLTGVVVPDVRFENELLYFNSHDHPVVKVYRPETDNRATSIGISRHKSELEQSKFSSELFTVIITNDRTLEHLHTTADAVVYACTEEIN